MVSRAGRHPSTAEACGSSQGAGGGTTYTMTSKTMVSDEKVR